MRVEWTEPALDDMVAIRDYIAEDSMENAYRFIEQRFSRDRFHVIF
jgi:plasmid stabilization system protein ParE